MNRAATLRLGLMLADTPLRAGDLAAASQRIPKYIAIRDAIAHEIESGQLASNAKLFSERALSEQFATTRVAVREALLALEMDGLIYRLDRRGWFVRAPRITYQIGRAHV